MNKKILPALLIVAAFIVSACAPATEPTTISTPTTEVITTTSPESTTAVETSAATEATEAPVVPVDYVIDPDFDEAEPFNPYGYAVVGVNTDGVMKYGVIGEDGAFVIEPEYDAFHSPANEIFNSNAETDIGYIWLQKDGLWGFVDESCEWVVEPSYEDCTCFSNFGLAGFMDDEKWGFISTTGEIVVEPKYDDVRMTDPGTYAQVANDGLWGLVDTTGKEVLAPVSSYQITYDGVLTMFGEWSSADQDIVLINDDTALITLDGRVIVDGATQLIESIGANQLVFVNKPDATGYYNMDGVLVIPLEDNEYGSVFTEEGIAIVTRPVDFATDSRRYIDDKGEVLFDKEFEYAFDFAPNGLAVVATDGKFGYIDKTGEFVIEPQYDYAHSFNADGIAVVIKDGLVGLIDGDGNLTTELEYDWLERVTPYDDEPSLIIAEKDGMSGIIDADGTIILPLQYSDIIIDDPYSHEGLNLENDSATTYVMIYDQGKFGILSEDGEILLPPVSDDSLQIAANGYTAVNVDGKYGYVTLIG